MSNKAIILDRLRAMDVPFELFEHEAAYTMEDCLALPFAQEDVTICKNMLLCNTKEIWLYLTLAGKRFRKSTVSKLIGTSRLQFAQESMLTELLETASGSLAPFGLWFDSAHKVRFAVDEAVRQTRRIAFHPCDNTATVVFLQEDFWCRVVPELGTEPLFLTVPTE